MQSIKTLVAATLLATAFAALAQSEERPNIIVLYADDISARELPIYESSHWSRPTRGNTQDPQYRAQTPVLDQMAREGCWIKTAWASVVCSPSRAMMMTGRYAHLHKWWGNRSQGKFLDEKGRKINWPLYLSSPSLIGHVAQEAGYGTYWAGKTQMSGDLTRFGFDQACFTPSGPKNVENPYTDFKLVNEKQNGKRQLKNADTGKVVKSYVQQGWNWFPHVGLMNHDDQEFQWWPNTPESQQSFGVNTFGADVELDFIFDFMQRQVNDDKPFFVYHTSHLGHDAFDWLNPDSDSPWPGTPVVKWDGQKYHRIEPRITGDAGAYDTHDTVTESGIHHHINYLDYQVWQYQEKLQQLGIADNTIFIFCADNGTLGYGKNSTDRQTGTHVPMIISAPAMTKRGQQNVLVNMSDILPTIAELTGSQLPEEYEINGRSLVSFLFGSETTHREWLYGYKDKEQLIRGNKVMRDGRGKWWDVENNPSDLISFPQIKDWDSVSAEHRAERDKLLAILPRFKQETHGKHAPSYVSTPLFIGQQTPKIAAVQKNANKRQWPVTFEDDFNKRNKIGSKYVGKPEKPIAWTVENGVLVGKQTNPDHGAVIRTEIDFDDAEFEFDFRFDGGSRFNFVIDDSNEKSVHAGHICRASVSAKSVSVGDDKTGAMNLEVRKQRNNKNLPKKEAAALKKLLGRTRSGAKVAIKQGQWHHLRLRIQGDQMEAYLDKKLVAQLKSPGFAHPTKTKFGFTANGKSIEFDNLVVRQPKKKKNKSPK